MYIDILQYIEDLKARLGRESRTYAAASQAYMDHADLRAHMQGSSVKLCAAGVYPFTKDKDQVIHSDPPFFFIGSRNSTGFGVYPAIGWEEEMEAGSVNEVVVKKVRDFLKANLPYDLPDEPLKT